ncbi:MAG: hypothetical protein RRA15_05275 [bacterium]|nr:hypothetical protein [bacterium]MDT8365886.1 hypothetical protein [bacterium]
MKTSDFLLLLLLVALIIGMLLTAIFGRGSRHGYGMAPTSIKTIKLVSI